MESTTYFKKTIYTISECVRSFSSFVVCFEWGHGPWTGFVTVPLVNMVIISCCASKVRLSHQTKKASNVKHFTVKRHSSAEADNYSDIRLEVADDLMSIWKRWGSGQWCERLRTRFSLIREMYFVVMFSTISNPNHQSNMCLLYWHVGWPS